MSIRYKVKSTAYAEDGTKLKSVHRIVGSLESAELARDRNIAALSEMFGPVQIITRKEVIDESH